MVKFGFVTCVQLGLSCLEAIYEIHGSVDLAITLKDYQARNKSGRIYMDEFCKKYSISLHKTSNVNNQDVIAIIRKFEIDWLFIIGWSQIASKDVLDAPKKGVIGIHPTLLPEGRGRAAIPWAILKRLNKTGVTLFKLDEGVDTGEIINQVEIPIDDKVSATVLYDLVIKSHVDLMESTFPLLENGSVQLMEQNDGLATEWPERKPEDGQIDLTGSVYDAECLIRAVTRPYPGAYLMQNDKKLIIWSAAVSDVLPDGIEGQDFLYFKNGYLILLEVEIIFRPSAST
ncbi:MAG: methionyl-tRNA formyltransferase [Maribacter sp.]|nr:methionyl-tRNA formyltransferase [Maribacter sp.]